MNGIRGYTQIGNSMAFLTRKPRIEMTSANLQLAFFHAQKQKYDLLVANVYIKQWLECDLLGVRRSGYVDELEIKLSRDDFRADFSKTLPVLEAHEKAVCCNGHDGNQLTWKASKHDLLAGGYGPINRFWFLAPADLLQESDMPAHVGLIAVSPTGTLQTIKDAPLLHNRKADDSFRYHCLRQQGWRVWDYMAGK